MYICRIHMYPGKQRRWRKVGGQWVSQADRFLCEALPPEGQERACLSLFWGGCKVKGHNSVEAIITYIICYLQEFDERGRKEAIPAGIYDLVCALCRTQHVTVWTSAVGIFFILDHVFQEHVGSFRLLSARVIHVEARWHHWLNVIAHKELRS